MGQNLTEDSGRLETQEKITVLDQRQSAGDPGRANTAGKSKGNLQDHLLLRRASLLFILAFN